jgi:hypothetical protein
VTECQLAGCCCNFQLPCATCCDVQTIRHSPPGLPRTLAGCASRACWCRRT